MGSIIPFDSLLRADRVREPSSSGVESGKLILIACGQGEIAGGWNEDDLRLAA